MPKKIDIVFRRKYNYLYKQIILFVEIYPSSITFKLVIFCLSSLHGSKANLENVYLTPTKEPLQCHEIAAMEIRSNVECALQCVSNLYSCAMLKRHRLPLKRPIQQSALCLKSTEIQVRYRLDKNP